MWSFYCFSSLLIVSALCKSNEATESINDAILHNCSNFLAYNKSEIVNFINQNIFSDCSNWTAINAINSTQQFSDKNENNIRCLLLYESFVSFCNYLPTTQLKNTDIIDGKNDNLTVDDACKSLLLLPKREVDLGRIKNVITDEDQCRYLCSTYLNGKPSLNRICGRSFYYSNFKLQSNNSHIEPSAPQITANKLPEPKEAPESAIKSVPELVISKVDDAPKEPVQKNEPPVIKIESSSKSKKEPIPPKAEPVELHIEEPSIPKNDSPNDAENEQEKQTYQTNVENQDQNIQNPEAIDNQGSNQEYLKDAEPKQEPVDDAQNEKPIEDPDYKQPDIKNPNLDNPNIDIEYENRNQENSDKPDLNEESQKNQDDRVVPERFAAVAAPKSDQFGEPYEGADADMEGNSNFFTYFSFICVAFVMGYVGYHNKQKVLALLLEGRNSRRPQRGRRPNSANYHKLDSNLEEAISSSCSKNASNVMF